MRITQALAALTLIIGFACQASAAPVFYTSSAAFTAAAAGIPLSVEDFDTTTPGAFPVVTPAGIGVSGVNTGGSAFVSSAIFASGQSAYFSTQPGGTSVSFSFPSPINAFGIDAWDLATVGSTTVTLSNSNGDSMSFPLPPNTTGNLEFFGLIDLMNSYTSVTFTNSDGGDFVELDNVQYGAAAAVPEPASLALWGLGLAAFGVWRRRRQA